MGPPQPFECQAGLFFDSIAQKCNDPELILPPCGTNDDKLDELCDAHEEKAFISYPNRELIYQFCSNPGHKLDRFLENSSRPLTKYEIFEKYLNEFSSFRQKQLRL